jgi:hypothetical protein
MSVGLYFNAQVCRYFFVKRFFFEKREIFFLKKQKYLGGKKMTRNVCCDFELLNINKMSFLLRTLFFEIRRFVL